MWLAKLERMINELPEQYLYPEPGNPEEMMLVPVGSKPVSQLTEEEKRLEGVSRQLWDLFLKEEEAHGVLHDLDENNFSSQDCAKHNKRMFLKQEEIQMIWTILIMSLVERLGFEHDYVIDGFDVYAISSVVDEALQEETGSGQSAPGDFDISRFGGIKH